MYRHRRHVYEPKEEYKAIGRIDRFPDKLLYKAVSGEDSPNGTNISPGSLAILNNSNCFEVQNGNIYAGFIDLEDTWSFQSWMYLGSAQTLTVFSVWEGSQRLFELTLSSSSLKIYRDLTASKFTLEDVSINVIENDWSLIHVERYKSELKVYVNLEEVYAGEFYGPLRGEIYIAEGLSGPPNQAFLDGIYLYGTTTLPYVAGLEDYKLVNFDSSDHVVAGLDIASENIQVDPLSSYNPELKAWVVDPQTYISGIKSGGADIYAETSVKHPVDYTFTLLFDDIEDVEKDSCLLVADYLAIYKRAEDQRYVYRGGSNSIPGTYIEYVLINNIKNGDINSISVSVYSEQSLRFLEIRLNGQVSQKVPLNVLTPVNISYSLNARGQGLNPAEFSWTVYNFTLYSNALPGYIIPAKPLKSTSKSLYRDSYRPHISESSYSLRSSLELLYDFDILLSDSNIAPGQVKPLNIVQISLMSPVEYKFKVELTKYDGPPSDIAIDSTTATMLAGTTILNNLLTLFNYPVNPYNEYFTVIVSNKYVSKRLQVQVIDSRVYNSSSYFDTSLEVFGYVNQNSSMVIAESSSTLTSSAPTVETFVDGFAGQIESDSAYELSGGVSGGRTFILAYQEYAEVTRRPYFGDSGSYVFNGGVQGELLGPVELLEGQYATAFNSASNVQSVAVSKTDNTAVFLDETSRELRVYYKDVLNNWVMQPVLLETGFTGTSWAQGVALDVTVDGAYIVLGSKNANNGEGFVQVWRRTTLGNYVKDLQLSSPVPQPNLSGFGRAVSLNQAGNLLTVSEQGSGKTYIYTKDVLWSATPVQTITEIEGYAYDLGLSSDGDTLFVLNSDLRQLRTYDRVSNTFQSSSILYSVDSFGYDKDTSLLITSDYDSSEVTLHTTTPITFSGNPNSTFGYSTAVSESGIIRIAIATPEDSLVEVYSSQDNFQTAASITGVNALGYDLSIGLDSILVTDYSTTTTLYTKDTSSLGQVVDSVRLNGSEVNGLTTQMPYNSLSLLSFRTEGPLVVSQIGTNRVGRFLDGYIKGFLIYSDRLSDLEIAEEEDKLARFLKLREYSIYDI